MSLLRRCEILLPLLSNDGHTVALLTLERNQVRPLQSTDIPHARELAAA
jgi:hypothetical protein